MNKKITLEDLDQSGAVMFLGGRIVGKQMFLRIMAEMRQYKTIEKELGIDLVTLFKAFKNGVYVKEIGRMTTVWKLVNDDGGTCLGAWHNDFEKEYNTIFLHLKDYGKTWALTKEELCETTTN